MSRKRKLELMVSERPSNFGSISQIKSGRKKSQRSIRISKIMPPIVENREPWQRVFLYVKLHVTTQIENVKNMNVLISHPQSSVTILADEHYERNIVKFSTSMPSFSLTIKQDNIEDINKLSDGPLEITFFEFWRQPEDDSEVDTEQDTQLSPIAQGHIDLLSFCCKLRLDEIIKVYIFPIRASNSSLSSDFTSFATTWNIYSVLPLLKKISFCNMVFITFESIYNAAESIQNEPEHLKANLYFQSKYLIGKDTYEKQFICSFSTFEDETIANQDTSIKWESMKNRNYKNFNSMGTQAGCDIIIHQLFKHLLCTEGVDFDFDSIDVNEDLALVCNSMHRYVLSKEMSAILEDVIAFDQQQILVEVCNSNNPEVILLEGFIDLSIFLYPNVKACRFAVQLKPPPLSKQQVGKAGTSRNSKSAGAAGDVGRRLSTGARLKPRKLSDARSVIRKPSDAKAFDANAKPTFAIINICMPFLLTEILDVNEDVLLTKKLKQCIGGEDLHRKKLIAHEDPYKNFDNLINSLITHIIKNNIMSLDDAKKFFCSCLSDLDNKLVKLIATDFNTRFPTKTNIEFSQLTTTVYKELEQIIHDILVNCKGKFFPKCFNRGINELDEIIDDMNIIKLSKEAGDETLSDFLYEKLAKKFPYSSELTFFKYLSDIEWQNFSAVSVYNELPARKKNMTYSYYTEWIDIYAKYKMDLEHEENFNEAFANLLNRIQKFVRTHPSDIQGWIFLNCLYKNCNYLPGISFTRWKYEELYNIPLEPLPILPKSRWELYCHINIRLHNNKGIYFCRVVKLFLILGMYTFAQIVFDQIAGEFFELKRYILTTNLKILLNDVEADYTQKFYKDEKAPNAAELAACQFQSNGNLANYRANTHLEMQNYANILSVKELTNYEPFHLGLLRYANFLLANNRNLEAVSVYEKLCTVKVHCMLFFMGIGKAMYKMNRLIDAEVYFAKSTYYKVHIPDVWAYLALINLKLGNNFKALEFWQYAKKDPLSVISPEILADLNKIDYRSISMRIDVPVDP